MQRYIETGSPLEAKPIPQVIAEQREFFAGEGDKKVFFWTEALRKEVESDNGWLATKDKAKLQLGSLPADLLPQILERFDPYLGLLSTGHSKGHVFRDLITTMELMRDPSMGEIDEVEKLVGILSGTFHDIGNSVINRYDESRRFSGHAEVGAYLFGEVAGDLIPPNLLKLTQFAIAAHTHYTKDIPITKTIGDREETLVKRPYNDDLVNGNKMGIWITRWADRTDTQGLQGFIRHGLTKALPTEDYSQEGFHEIHEDEKEDFLHHFSPVLRTDEERAELSPQKRTRNVLEHIQMFRQSALNKSVYSQHDSDFFRNALIVPASEEQLEFVDAVLGESAELQQAEIDEAFEQFYAICKVVEPGSDIDETISLFREKFALLDPPQRLRWANGFRALPNLYSRWYRRMEERLSEDSIPERGSTLGKIVVIGNRSAQQKLKEFEIQ